MNTILILALLVPSLLAEEFNPNDVRNEISILEIYTIHY